MRYNNDISDMIRFSLVTFFILVFSGVLLYFVLLAVKNGAGYLYRASLSEAPQATQKKNEEVAKPAKDPIKMIFVGDVMLDRGVEYMVNKYGSDDWKFPFLKVADFLKTADVVFGNLEGPISDKGYRAGSIYSFESDPKVIDSLIYADFSIMSVANNHMFDYTRAALEDTLDRLKETGIAYVGAGSDLEEAITPKFLEVKGNKIAFLAYADFNVAAWEAAQDLSGFAPLNEENLKNGIAAAKEAGADIIIVSFHFGEEYQETPNAKQKKWAYFAVDNGANLVIGHHPHVIQPIEEYMPPSETGILGGSLEYENLFNFKLNAAKTGEESENERERGWIAYSLGNFVFDQYFSEETTTGELLEVWANNGKITNIEGKKVLINRYYQPEISD